MVVVRFNNIRDYLTISNMDITINVVNHIIISIFIDHVLVRIWSWILILPREKKTFWYSLIIMTFVSKVMAEGFEHHKPSHFVLSENWIPQKFDGWSSCFHIVPIKTPFKIAIWDHLRSFGGGFTHGIRHPLGVPGRGCAWPSRQRSRGFGFTSWRKQGLALYHSKRCDFQRGMKHMNLRKAGINHP